MTVRFENVRDRDVLRACELEINLDVWPWIKDRRATFFIIADQIRNFSQSFGRDCLEN